MGKKDRTTRTTKILQKMAKPLYDDPQDSKYIVVGNPFGRRDPFEDDSVNRISAWISEVFGRKGVVESLYSHTNKEEVILQLPYDVDIERMLGVHKNASFLAKGWNKADEASTIFQYNYRSHGEPTMHGWKEHFPMHVDPPGDLFVKPYPAPSRADPPSILALPLPPSPEDEAIRFLRTVPQPSSSIKMEPEEAYQPSRDLDDAMQAYDKSRTAAPAKTVKSEPGVKQEPELAYEPSQDLEDALSLFHRSKHAGGVAIVVKQEPSDFPSNYYAAAPTVKPDPNSAYTPIPELEAALRELSSARTSLPAVINAKPEPEDSMHLGLPGASRAPPPSRHSIKAEPVDNHLPSAAVSKPTKAMLASLVPRTSQKSSDHRTNLPSFKKNKRPLSEEDSKGSVKRTHI
ncbi:hypothetical protein FA95DRAFT_1566176 [Auriscalpium vulgare]|uniref:Uncharacterized protein n=1 Tax=Auriscalpium vulgare TaxID=40419 RepID=A0ACB8R9K6_9AGAM|nr:hypothetical protein FA95DRAFT_1566176 [Auriscalpium vulgare]